MLHAIIIAAIKDFETAAEAVCAFLPFVDNWAVCDSLSPKVFAKNKTALKEYIEKWLQSGETYTVRFALKMIMTHFLDGDFEEEYLKIAAAVKCDEYYISMMVAWLFATAIAKQYESAVKYIETGALDRATHNRAIQKAAESYRVPQERKEYLKKLKIKGE